MKKDTVQQLAEKFMYDFFELEPGLASHFGLSEYDSRLASGSPEQQLQLKELYANYKKSFEALAGKGSYEQELDVRAMTQFLERELFEMEKLPFMRSKPSAPGNVISSLYTVFSREETPLLERFDSIEKQLAQVPAYMEDSKGLTERPVKLWVENASQASRSFPQFLKSIRSAAHSVNYGSFHFEDVCRKAVEAFENYDRWLTDKILPSAKEEFAIGEELLSEFLAVKRIGYSPAQLLELGEYYLKTTKEKMERLRAKIDSSMTLEDIKERIREDHPADFEAVLEYTGQCMEKAKQYVSDSGFADIPSGEILEVKETPDMFRHHIPLAAYMPPGRFQKRQIGTYIVTNSEEQGTIRDFNRTAVFNKSIHEAYPGHHLQFVCANRHPSMARIFTSSPEFVEGWAHYCEEYVALNGFPDNYRLHFTMNWELVWKACRILIDVNLSSGRMSFNEAVEMLMGEAGFSRASASAEVNRYTYTPTYQLSYLLGKHMILKLRDELKEKYGPLFSERDFHNLFLNSGLLPMNLLSESIRRAFEKKCGRAGRENGAPSAG